MKYQDIPHISKARFEAEMPCADLREKVDLLLGIHLCTDWRWVQSVYLHWMHHEDYWVAGAAITGLGHLARNARRIDKAEVVPALEALAQSRPEMAGRVEDTVADIELFAR